MKPTVEPTSVCLVECARTDRVAFSELFRRHYDEIYRYCARRLPGRSHAEDVTSGVFLKMVRNFHKFMGDETAFRSWLYRIACNEVNSFYRKSGREAHAMDIIRQQPTETENDPLEDIATEDDNAAKLTALREAMETLESPCREIVSLRFLQGLNSDQIGDILDMKPATVRSRLARALKKLKLNFENSGDSCWYE